MIMHRGCPANSAFETKCSLYVVRPDPGVSTFKHNVYLLC